MEFNIDPAFICSLTVTEYRSAYSGMHPDEITGDELVDVLRGKHTITMISTIDHPKFTELRDNLEHLGYIVTQRNSWNGDTVLKPFYLNGWRFKKNHRFPCAAALKNSIECARKYGRKTLLL